MKRLFETLSMLLKGLFGDAQRPYRPERHYMRGPGPACRSKTGNVLGAK